MLISAEDLFSPQVVALLEEHLRDMHATSPVESIHALALEELRRPDISCWSLWDDDNVAGFAALKELDRRHGEIKSMRTAKPYRRRGVAVQLLNHIFDVARERGYRRLSLETGSQPFFEPARQLYGRMGFRQCPPFGQYREDPNSVFMTMDL